MYALKVKADGTQYVLIGRESIINEVRVVYNVTTKQEAPDDGEDQIHSTVEGNEDANKASHHLTNRSGQASKKSPGRTKGNESTEKERTHSREVVL